MAVRGGARLTRAAPLQSYRGAVTNRGWPSAVCGADCRFARRRDDTGVRMVAAIGRRCPHRIWRISFLATAGASTMGRDARQLGRAGGLVVPDGDGARRRTDAFSDTGGPAVSVDAGG